MSTTVYICSPFRAKDSEQQKLHIDYAKELSRRCVLKGFSVITPHLYYTNFLDDDDELERKMGLESARNLILKCDYMAIGFKYGVSEGMRAEIEFAYRHHIPIDYLVEYRKTIRKKDEKVLQC